MGLFSRRKKEEADDFMDLSDLTPKKGVYGPGRGLPPATDDLGMPGLPEPSAPMSLQQSSSDMVKKDIEVLSSKIEALKSEIEALTRRLQLLEERMKLKAEESSMEKYGTPSAPPQQTPAGWHF